MDDSSVNELVCENLINNKIDINVSYFITFLPFFKIDNFPSLQTHELISKNQFVGRTIGVFTSGGDAQGKKEHLYH